MLTSNHFRNALMKARVITRVTKGQYITENNGLEPKLFSNGHLEAESIFIFVLNLLEPKKSKGSYSSFSFLYSSCEVNIVFTFSSLI